VEPVATIPVDAAANLRRSAVVAAGFGVLATVVLALLGHPWAGIFVCVGMALGALNNALLQRSVARYTRSPHMGRSQFSGRVLVRLGLITMLAFAVALLVRPDGFGVFAGLAAFQVLMLVGASVPVFRSLRQSQ
jgi:ATP synthase I chain